MTQVADQRTAEANGADYGITGYVPEEIDDSMPENSTMVQGHDYYLTARGQRKDATNKLLLRTFSEVLTFAPFTYIDEFLTQPLFAQSQVQKQTRLNIALMLLKKQQATTMNYIKLKVHHT